MERTEDEDSGELGALTDLIKSEGWRVYRAMVEAEWGADATLSKIDSALKTIARGDTEAVTDTVTQIQASRREVLKALELPKQRVQHLTPRERTGGVFAGLKRVSR